MLIAAILIAASALFSEPASDKLMYSDIVDLFENEQVDSFVVKQNNDLILQTKDGKTLEFTLRSLDLFERDLKDLILKQQQEGIITEYTYEEPTQIPWWVSLLPYVVIIVLFIVLWMYVMSQAAGGKGGKIGSFGKAHAKLGTNEKNRVTFADVAGADEEKQELEEVVEFLKNPQKYAKLGAKVPKGVLLVGPPGTGKTLLAKAVAGEANVPFFSISGSDFVEMYVGVGASRVRDLFDTAKKSTNAIIFIDEIDAVGRHRGAGLGGGHDEREQTLNQLLVEMDGFGNTDGIIVMAATNRPDILDPALLRPGRFDRQITVNYPDLKGREEILKVHAKNKPFEKDVNLKTLAKSTAGFTGADLANLLNEAALLAARRGKNLIGMSELEDATIKVIVGPKKTSRVISEREKKITAFHEAGHAVITQLLKTQDDVHQISIIPSGRAGGYTLSLPQEDKMYMSKLEMEEEIISLLGGRVAEQLVIGDITTGASNDIERATKMARSMVTKYGMSENLGPVVYGTGHDEVFLGKEFGSTRDYSERIASDIDGEIRRIIGTAYKKAEEILGANRNKLDFTANYLIEHETMDGEQFALVMSTDEPTVEALEEIEKKKSEKSNAENRDAGNSKTDVTSSEDHGSSDTENTDGGAANSVPETKKDADGTVYRFTKKQNNGENTENGGNNNDQNKDK